MNTLRKQNIDNVDVYADMEGYKVNGGTVPPEVAFTASRPDIVIVMKNCSPQKVILLELTVPWDRKSNIASAFQRKEARYETLAMDIEAKGFECLNLPHQVGTRGLISQRDRNVLLQLCSLFNIRKWKNLREISVRLHYWEVIKFFWQGRVKTGHLAH